MSTQDIIQDEAKIRTALGPLLGAEDFQNPKKVTAIKKRFDAGEDLPDRELTTLLNAKNQFDFESDKSVYFAIPAPQRPMIAKMKQRLLTEYLCDTAAELGLVDVILLAYSRVLMHSETIRQISVCSHMTDEQRKMFNEASKDLDRANRHYTNALQTMHRLKQPGMKVEMTINNAFVGQNQQFN